MKAENLSSQAVLEIFLYRRSGESFAKIGRRYGISGQSVANITERKSRTDVNIAKELIEKVARVNKDQRARYRPLAGTGVYGKQRTTPRYKKHQSREKAKKATIILPDNHNYYSKEAVTTFINFVVSCQLLREAEQECIKMGWPPAVLKTLENALSATE